VKRMKAKGRMGRGMVRRGHHDPAFDCLAARFLAWNIGPYHCQRLVSLQENGSTSLLVHTLASGEIVHLLDRLKRHCQTCHKGISLVLRPKPPNWPPTYNRKPTISSREIETSIRLIRLGELAKHSVFEGTKVVTKYSSSTEYIR
jgi:hypothetical protein